jgi:hypothetical protein
MLVLCCFRGTIAGAIRGFYIENGLIRFINTTGQTVFVGKIENLVEEKRIGTDKLADGLYTFTIEIGENA